MTSMNIGYDLLQSSTPKPRSYQYNKCISVTTDRMMPVTTMHRMALKAIEKVILLMNNTRMLTRHHRLASMNDVLVYLTGNHEDQGMPGDRGDFYRRKLAEQLYVHFGIRNVDHTNVMSFIEGLIRLERDCRGILARSGCQRSEAPPINVDGQILDIIGVLAGVI